MPVWGIDLETPVFVTYVNVTNRSTVVSKLKYHQYDFTKFNWIWCEILEIA